MQFHFHANQSHFHKNGFALRLVLKQRQTGTRKWSIVLHLQGVEGTKKRLGFWKMNTSHLSDEKFIQLMKRILKYGKKKEKNSQI